MSSYPGVPVQTLRNAYASVNVNTSAWVELDASIDKDVTTMEIFDSSGETLKLSIGPASGSEVDTIHIMPGGNGLISLMMNQGQRLAIRAVSANATVGELIINMYS